MVHKLYIDESGYTGEKYLTTDQPYLVFASIFISESQAIQIVSNLKTKYRLQGRNLKGRNLVKTSNGQKAILDFLTKKIKARIIYIDKVYSLCAKFFEYVFEPVVSNFSSIFYELDFHRYLSNLLMYYYEKDENLKNLFFEFENFLRGLPNNFNKEIIEYNPASKEIRLNEIFCFAKNYFKEYYSDYKRNEKKIWEQDLSITSVYSLMCDWANEVKDIVVICDESKPLESNYGKILNKFNKQEKNQFAINNKVFNLNYSINGDIQFNKSKDVEGLQLADLLASSFFYSLKNKNSKFGKNIIKNCFQYLVPEYCIFPSYNEYCFENSKKQITNDKILNILSKRTDITELKQELYRQFDNSI